MTVNAGKKNSSGAVFLPCTNRLLLIPAGESEKLYDLRGLDRTEQRVSAPHLLLLVTLGLFCSSRPASQSFGFSELL